MRRSFDIDMGKCPSCGSENFKVFAVIEDHEVVGKILIHVGLEARAPPIAPARVQQELDYQEYFD